MVRARRWEMPCSYHFHSRNCDRMRPGCRLVVGCEERTHRILVVHLLELVILSARARPRDRGAPVDRGEPPLDGWERRQGVGCALIRIRSVRPWIAGPESRAVSDSRCASWAVPAGAEIGRTSTLRNARSNGCRRKPGGYSSIGGPVHERIRSADKDMFWRSKASSVAKP